ncbi:MAG TPA: hypothetical protein VHV28_01245 [Solirubrobacteraceae bacterium]|jgi:hypothetical protein|nr:hypothetical protein [Solirubrobacteraceae bacterium]
MTAAARTLAIVAVIGALALAVRPAPASAGIGATLCAVGGLVSGVLGKVCTVASDPGRVLNAGKKLAGGHLGGAIGALTGSASQTVARTVGVIAIAAGVIGGAQYALKLTAKAIGATTNPNLEAVWFSSSYWRMAAVAALLTVPFLLAAAIQAMLQSDLSLLMRSAFGYLPLGLLAVGVAAPLTGLLLAGSDEMSAIVSTASGHAGASVLDRVGFAGGVVSSLSGSLFVSFFIALFTIAAAFTLWLELLIRQAAVYVIVLMLPLFFAAMVWPARRIWAVRAVELLVALILSKFAIVAVLGLGGAALGHTLLPGIGTILAGTTLVLLAAFSPWAMLRLLPLHELAGAAAGGLRPHAAQPPQMADKRAHGATDAAETAAGDNGGDGGEAASEDVAAGLPGRLRAFMRQDRNGAEDAPEADAGARVLDAESGSGPRGGVAHDDGAATTGLGHAAASSADPASASATAGAAPSAAEPMSAAAPETDAFGPTIRYGELPAVFQNMSLDADVLALDQPFAPDGGGLAAPDPPALPEPPGPPEAEGEPG